MDKLSQNLQETDRRIRVTCNKDSEVLRIQRSIEKTVLLILNRVHLIDRRLSLRLLKVGSYYDGLKTGLPDEFDFLAEMINMKEGKDFIVRSTGFNGTRNLWKCSKGQPGRRKIQYIGDYQNCIEKKDENESQKWTKNIGAKKEPEYLLDCISVKNTFYFAVLEVFETLRPEDLPKYLHVVEQPTFIHGPAVTLGFIWNGRSFKNLTISVDITICVKVDDWRMCIDAFDRIIENSCIASRLRNALDKDGYHLTPYLSDRGHTCQWRVSTSYTEHLIMDSFSYDSKVKIAVRCLKHKRDQHIAKLPELSEMEDRRDANFFQFLRFYQGDDEQKQLVTSYMIKTTALMTLGLLSRKWFNRIPLSVMFTYFVIKLYALIKYNDLRMFFISDYKLRVPAFGDILPGFKSLVDTMDEELVPQIATLNTGNDDVDGVAEETKLEFQFTNEIFKQMKSDVKMHYTHLWRSKHENRNRSFDRSEQTGS